MTVHSGPASAAPAIVNGYHHPPTSKTWPAATALQAPPASPADAATKPRRKVNLHGDTFLRPLVYAGAVVIASWGGVEAAAPKFHLPAWGALPLWLFIEAFGVLMMAIARKELEKNRKLLACIAAVASAGVAGGVAWLNYVGHSDNIWVAAVFSGASLAAYGTFVLTSIDSALDVGLLTGRREAKGFRYPLTERILHPRRTRLATEILSRTEVKDPGKARVAAIDHPVMLAFIRHRLLTEAGPDGKVTRRSPAEVDGILLVLRPHTLVTMFEEQMGPYRADLVTAIVSGFATKSLLGAAAPKPKLPQVPRIDVAAVRRPTAQAAPTPPPARRSTTESAALYLELRTKHGLFDKTTGAGWRQSQFADAMGVSPQRLRTIKSESNVIDAEQ